MKNQTSTNGKVEDVRVRFDLTLTGKLADLFLQLKALDEFDGGNRGYAKEYLKTRMGAELKRRLKQDARTGR